MKIKNGLFKGRWFIRATQIMETNKKMMLTMMKIAIVMVNDDDDDVKMLDNISNGISNVNL